MPTVTDLRLSLSASDPAYHMYPLDPVHHMYPLDPVSLPTRSSQSRGASAAQTLPCTTPAT
jgi:hypothetical protein